MFTPAPNVDSAIVKIDLIESKHNITNKSTFDNTIKCAFGNRRKTLYNNIKSFFGLNSDTATDILNSLQLPLDIRGEKLNTEQFVALSNTIDKYIK